jgi:nicotinamidase-related amidase
MTETEYPRDISALIIIDPLNDFLSEGGKLHDGIKSELERVKFIPNLIRLVEGARKAGLQIVYAPHGVDEHSFDDVPYLHSYLHKNTRDQQYFWKGTWGADFYEPLRPQEGDIIASQHRLWNSFRNTDLDAKLRARGIQKVALAGLTSHKCVESTGRHAFEEGYHVTFLHDATAEFNRGEHAAALTYSFPLIGHADLSVDEFLAKL